MRRIWGTLFSAAFFFSVAAQAAVDNTKFTLTTDAFLDTGALPVLYTCDGKDVSPQLSWTNPPAKTQSFAVIGSDEDAPGGTFYHWVVYNIPANTTELAEGVKDFPAKTLLGQNSWNKAEYDGPCPPKGTAHKYTITLYALDTMLKLPAGADGKTVLSTIKDHTIDKAQLTTIYSRWLK